MEKKKQIRTLQELLEEKEQVRKELEVAQREMRYCTLRIRDRLRDRLLRQVLLPASLAGLAAFGIREMTHSENGETMSQNGERPKQDGTREGALAGVVLKVLDNLL